MKVLYRKWFVNSPFKFVMYLWSFPEPSTKRVPMSLFCWTGKNSVARSRFQISPFWLPNFKGIVQRILRGVETRLVPSVLINWRFANFFVWKFKGTLLQEEHTTIFSGLKINEMGLSTRSDFPAISVCVRLLTRISSILDYDSPLSSLLRKMASRHQVWENWHIAESQCTM
jgi:hypothetical protein